MKKVSVVLWLLAAALEYEFCSQYSSIPSWDWAARRALYICHPLAISFVVLGVMVWLCQNDADRDQNNW